MQHSEGPRQGPLSLEGGVIVPVITPVDDRDRVDEAAYRRILRRLAESGAQALFVGGSAGEGPLLAWSEWVRMAEIAFDETRGALPLLGGVSETSTARVIERIKVLKTIGYRYFVATPVFYLITDTADEHLRLFSACHDAADGMEMIPYNIPKFTSTNIPVETLVDMARRGWIRTVKESSGNLGYLVHLIEEGRPYGLRVFTGDESQMKAALEAGAAGIVPGCANFEPETFLEAYRAGTQRDTEALACAFDRMMILREVLVLSAPCWLAGIKYAVACLGIGSGKPVSPLQPLTDAQQALVRDFVARGK